VNFGRCCSYVYMGFRKMLRFASVLLFIVVMGPGALHFESVHTLVFIDTGRVPTPCTRVRQSDVRHCVTDLSA
jgi:hypothetical protein